MSWVVWLEFSLLRQVYGVEVGSTSDVRREVVLLLRLDATVLDDLNTTDTRTCTAETGATQDAWQVPSTFSLASCNKHVWAKCFSPLRFDKDPEGRGSGYNRRWVGIY